MKYQFRRAVLILLLFVVLAGSHLFINTQNIGLKYKTTDLKIKLSEIRSKNRYLQVQVARKENLKLVEKTAREQLKMVYPQTINYILPTAAKASREAIVR